LAQFRKCFHSIFFLLCARQPAALPAHPRARGIHRIVYDRFDTARGSADASQFLRDSYTRGDQDSQALSSAKYSSIVPLAPLRGIAEDSLNANDLARSAECISPQRFD